MWKKKNSTFAIASLAMLVIGACGQVRNNNGTTEDQIDAGIDQLRVGGNVIGLVGTLTISLNGSSSLTIDTNGFFTFPDEVFENDPYEVAILEQPIGQECVIPNGTGIVPTFGVGDVAVECTSLAQLDGLDLLGTPLLLPAFSPTELNYQADASFLGSAIRLVPFSLSPGATITVNSMPVESGTESAPILLEFGSNIVNVTVSTDLLSTIYSVNVIRGMNRPQELISGRSENSTLDKDGFGRAVAISGDTIVIGVPLNDSGASGVNGNLGAPRIDGAGAVYVFRRIDHVWQQEAFLKAGSPSNGDNFGRSVAIFGDTIVVGAPGEDSDGSSEDDSSKLNSGAVYVFQYNGSNWEQEQFLKASNLDSGDRFGQSVAIFNNTLVVGAQGEDSKEANSPMDNSESSAGAAYVFSKQGLAAWEQDTFLKAFNTQQSDLFGTTVAISGTHIAVGAIHEDSSLPGINNVGNNNTSSNSGAVYMYKKDGADWLEDAYIKASNPSPQDNFGSSLALRGPMLIVGSPNEDGATNTAVDSGAVYVFHRGTDSWVQDQLLRASNANDDAKFGNSVSLARDTMVVGAPHESSNTAGVDASTTSEDALTSSGAIYGFRLNGQFWQEETFIKASSSEIGDAFGTSVAISQDTIVTGAPGEDGSSPGLSEFPDTDNTSLDSGAIYIYQ